MNLMILTESDRIGDSRFEVRGGRASHIVDVLRLAQGDQLEIGLVNGGVGRGTILSLDNQSAQIEAGDLVEPHTITPAIDLICALPRPQTLKKVLLISATMGVRRLHLIRANRVEKSYYHSPLLQPDNYRPHLLDGLSQGKHTRVPEVTIHERFKPFFEDYLPVAEKDEGAAHLKVLPEPGSHERLSTLPVESSAQIQIAIGPEGGWVPFELELMQEYGFQLVDLGRWVLRVENAVTAVLAQLEMLRPRS